MPLYLILSYEAGIIAQYYVRSKTRCINFDVIDMS